MQKEKETDLWFVEPSSIDYCYGENSGFVRERSDTSRILARIDRLECAMSAEHGEHGTAIARTQKRIEELTETNKHLSAKLDMSLAELKSMSLKRTWCRFFSGCALLSSMFLLAELIAPRQIVIVLEILVVVIAAAGFHISSAIKD